MTTAQAPLAKVEGRLVAGMDAEELAGLYGTPLFVYDLDLVTARVRALQHALPPSFDLAFAVKANPLLALLEHLRSLGIGADVASGGELGQVGRAGFEQSRVI